MPRHWHGLLQLQDHWPLRGWREPGNMTLQRGRIFGLVLFKRKVTDQEERPAGQTVGSRSRKDIPGPVQNN